MIIISLIEISFYPLVTAAHISQLLFFYCERYTKIKNNAIEIKIQENIYALYQQTT
jgi:hypothetical protein